MNEGFTKIMAQAAENGDILSKRKSPEYIVGKAKELLRLYEDVCV
jgi:hypothetical protein